VTTLEYIISKLREEGHSIEVRGWSTEQRLIVLLCKEIDELKSRAADLEDRANRVGR
jgi:hypothetical protein